MPEISKEELEELRRLRLVEKATIAGLKEVGFSDKALEFFRYRKNFLLLEDPLKDGATIGGFTGACGDHVDVYLRVEGNIIKDAKFMTDGCPGAVTSAAAMTEVIKDETIDRAAALKVSDIVDFLREGSKGLPEHMHDCCAIAIGALREAIK